MFYSYNGNSQREISGIDALSYLIDVVGGATYQFHVRAVTIKPGPNATLTVNVPEYGMKTSFSILDKKLTLRLQGHPTIFLCKCNEYKNRGG